MTPEEIKLDKYYQKKFGWSLAQVDTLFADQDSVCAICRRPPGKYRLSLDHDHAFDRIKLFIERLPDWNFAAFSNKTDASCIAIGATKKEARENGKRVLRRRSVRGGLCMRCNKGIQMFEDSKAPLSPAERFDRAALYFRQFAQQKWTTVKKLLALALISLLSVTAFANDSHRAIVKRAHTCTRTIRMQTLTDKVKCSATAIGPHALLTASHCELPTSEVSVDGTKTKIIKLLRDDNDHTVLITDGDYKDFAAFDPNPAAVGDTIFIFGNPGTHEDMFRQGNVVSIQKEFPDSFFSDRTPSRTIYDLNVFSGDSGAAIFSESGEIVGVVSLADIQTNSKVSGWTIKFMISFGFAFSQDQLLEAQK